MFRRFFGRSFFLILTGAILGIVFLFAAHEGSRLTSTDSFCESCHVHPHSTISWKQSTHYKNKTGMVIHCVDCHLPPEGVYYYTEKVRTGVRDIYGKFFTDTSKIDWEAKSVLEYATTYTYDESCLRCHQDLYSLNLSTKGIQAHENYVRNREKGIRCINCHLYVGHYSDKQQEQQILEDELILTERPGAPAVSRPRRVLPPLTVSGPIPGEKFANYVETIPGTSVKFEMVAIPGGEFDMGSRPDEPYRRRDEGPVHRVRVSPFWIGKAEVSWAEFEEFYSDTVTRAKNEKGLVQEELETVDAITGPTPPYGSPDQGWGRGDRPAITMTHYAARVYCEWLSRVTGKRYRLPTEAEWEYACRAGTTTPYFFEGNPKDFTRFYWLNRWFGLDLDPLAQYARYAENSGRRTHPPDSVKPNPWGLLNMIGNVKEFCLDWYDPQAYSRYSDEVAVDPKGPEDGEEHVIRGGSYRSDAIELRSAARDYTRTADWLTTDPQSPKSIWWYSDATDVGFRVVREFEGEGEEQARPASAGSAVNPAAESRTGNQ